jgi:hypothetical protein
MTQLSPAAQKVQAAFWEGIQHIENVDEFNLAAALRAVADLVVPETPKPSGNSDWDVDHWILVLDSYYQRKNTRVQILAIATELEGFE